MQTGALSEKMLIDEIANDIVCFDLIFLIEDKELAEQFCISDALAASAKKVKIYLPYEIGSEIPLVSCRQISSEEQEFILDLYYLYDFSDRFILFSKALSFGWLFNFVETGWLTMDEAFRALLIS